MKGITTLILLLMVSIGYAQTLPMDFETTVTTSNFVDFDGGIGTVIPNPQSSGINTSATVAQIVRNGGEIWSGSKITLTANLDFSTNSIISMKVFTTAPIGTVVKFKLEGGGAADERDATTTVTGAWETLTWDFTGTPSTFNDIVFMFDFGNVGDGSANSTFLFDDVEQIFGGTQIDFPVNFEGATINYSMTDFGGNVSSLVADPTNASNHVIKTVKTDQGATWAGTTIGTPSGFATNLPFTATDSKMTVRVWSPDAGIAIRLKVENSSNNTQTCETEVISTIAGGWEDLEFDFANEASGTAALSFGLTNGWTYNMASIFFNFGIEGQAVGEKTYYFDDVKFGALLSSVSSYENNAAQLTVFPNPANDQWTIYSENTNINSIEIFDLQGKRLLFVEPNTRNAVINAADFATGMYISKVSTDLGTRSMKLIKK